MQLFSESGDERPALFKAKLLREQHPMRAMKHQFYIASVSFPSLDAILWMLVWLCTLPAYFFMFVARVICTVVNSCPTVCLISLRFKRMWSILSSTLCCSCSLKRTLRQGCVRMRFTSGHGREAAAIWPSKDEDNLFSQWSLYSSFSRKWRRSVRSSSHDGRS